MPRHVVSALRPQGRQWIWALSAAGLVLNGLRHRKRLEALWTVEAASEPESGPAGAAGGDTHGVDLGRFTLVTVDGVVAAPAALAAAVAHAERESLDVLDLVPPDLDLERVIELVRLVDPATYRGEPLAVGRSAHQAVLVDRELLGRLDVKLPDGPVEEADLAELIVDAKCFAPQTCDLAVVPGVHAAAEQPGRRRDLLRVINGDENGSAATLAGLGVLGAGVVAAPGWGLLALLAYCGQPSLALGESPLRAGLPPGAGALRPLRSAARALRTVLESGRTRRADELQAELDQSAVDYRRLLAAGTGRFTEPRRDTCPWCGGDDLAHKVEDVVEFAQLKPGRFTVDQCQGCGHVFSNPSLSPEGLDFYYRDFYSGLFEHALTKKFQVDEPLYKLRADIVRRHHDGEPTRWLDVGTGHGHFALSARRAFPHTRFEALDMGEAVLTAERRGWIDEAHHGLLPDMADDLADSFDVVSMHHCLEHTPDTRDQLSYLKRIVRPGGFLSIEVPDPECWAGDTLGKWWGPWFQPQHQNMVPIGNLCAALRAEGFTVVDTEREEAHEQFEATMATFLRLNWIGPPPGLPWREQRVGDTARRVVVFTLGAPLLAAAVAVDKLAEPFVRGRPNGPNAYRVLARLDGGGSGDRGTATGTAAARSAGDDAVPTGHPGRRGLADLSRLAPDPTPAPAAPSGAVTAGPSATPAGPTARPAGEPVSLVGAPAWAGALLDALGPEVGAAVGYAAVPRDLEPDPLPDTYAFQLQAAAGDRLPAAWQGPMVVCLADDRAAAERAAAAMGVSNDQGLPAPTVRAIVALAGVGAGGADRWALVTERPGGKPMLELIGPHLNYFESVLAGFAAHHAALHNRTVGTSLSGDVVPTVDPLAEIARFDAERYPAQVEWLRARVAPPGAPVLCHGGFEPRCVSGPGVDEWDAYGGPGHGLVVANWRNAVLAERELDIGLTLMAFWVAPMYVDHRALRAQFKMIRNKLASRYLRSYAAHAPLDDKRVAFWQAFHALRVVAQLDGAYDAAGAPFGPPDVASAPRGLSKELSRLFRIVTARERHGETQEAV